jgi:hypothetical protein
MRISEVFSDMRNLIHADDATIQSRFAIGGNRPPDALELSQSIMGDFSRFLADTPVINSFDLAKQAGLWAERVQKLFGDMEDERDRQVRPLNEQVADINTRYKAIHNADPKRPGVFDKLLAELRYRLTAYARAEEDKRIAAAEAARKIAEEAERIAREAEAREQEAKANADVGELANVGAAIAEADQKFSDFERAKRAAAVAERGVPVRISSSLGGRAMSMRTKETLILDDAEQALKAIGVTEKIREALLSAARDYRKLKGQLPPGVSSQTERSI